jgi:hypothetical protein
MGGRWLPSGNRPNLLWVKYRNSANDIILEYKSTKINKNVHERN